MGLQLILSGNGYGKTTTIIKQIVEKALDREKRFFIIVPDQFTLETQYQCVQMAGKGIINIDVLSFSRLSHRIEAETGATDLQRLDDTGKNLIIRKCAGNIKDKIPFLAGNIDKVGYIHELKSVISEFLQYGIKPKDLKKMQEEALQQGKKGLANKLDNLEKVYSYFQDYIKDKYITNEETMDILSEKIIESKLCSDSIVVLDGFTGFTPIQYKVIESLLKVCDKVYVTLTLKHGNLFSLTAETRNNLCRIANKLDVPILNPVYLENKRKAQPEDLKALEEILYQEKNRIYEKETNNIQVLRSKNIHLEVRNVLYSIKKTIMEEHAYYKDFAIITGDLSIYRQEIIQLFSGEGIPFFIDETRRIILNPFIEFIKGLFLVIGGDFKKEDVILYIKTGFIDIEDNDCDLFENYLLESNITGYRTYSKLFTKKTREMIKNGDETSLEKINTLRKKIVDSLRLFQEFIGEDYIKVKDITEALYSTIVNLRCEQQLKAYSEYFSNTGDLKLSMEYAQVYRETIELLDQVYDCLGNEDISIKEYSDIISAGFQEIRLGVIPGNSDRVIVGDLERTRLQPVKYMFFIGMNEGWINGNSSGGIISEPEREFLENLGNDLAPSNRKKLYINRFYLYTMLTKPLKKLYISYVTTDENGKNMQPFSIIKDMNRIFPKLEIKNICIEDCITNDDLPEILGDGLRQLLDGTISKQKYEDLLRIAHVIKKKRGNAYVNYLCSKACSYYSGTGLEKITTGILYGQELVLSVSRLEQYAACSYSYFLRYVMGLTERNEYGIRSVDTGNIYHGVLEAFSRTLKERKISWSQVSEEEIREIISEKIQLEAEKSGELFFEKKSNKYILDKLKQILIRTVLTIKNQLSRGDFIPGDYELEFVRQDCLDVKNEATGNNEKLRIIGKIDRIDLAGEDDIIIKIMDYKSGGKSFSIGAFYRGLQLQIPVYMNEAIKIYQRKNTVIPGAMLYYHINDPLVENPENDAGLENGILKKLRTGGIINSNPDIINHFDKDFEGESLVLPIKNKNGIYEGNGLVDEEDMHNILNYCDIKIKELGEEIMSGSISMNPKHIKTNNLEYDSCQYCDYKNICEFDELEQGFVKEEIKINDEEALKLIRIDTDKGKNNGRN